MIDDNKIAPIDGRLEYEIRAKHPDDIDFERIHSEEEDYESAPPEYEIHTYPADFTLEVLHQKWKAHDIEIPQFQRQFVWRQIQASKLIESFLIGLPVPSVFLYTERKSQKFLVIDGQQRLRSVFYYFDGLFGEETKGKRQVFQLKGLSEKSRYFNKSYEDLDEADQRKLHNCVLRSFIVQQLDPNDETSIYHIFERLNTGGTLLANQEIRNCVYRGSLNSLLHELNKLSEWRRIVGRPEPDSRQKDVELMLRFFALLSIDHYEKPMKDFLSKFMKANRDPEEGTAQDFKNLFTQTCNTVIDCLGEKPFHIRAGLNSAVFDCVMVGFAKHLDSVPSDIRDRYEALTKPENTVFLKTVTSSTTDKETLKDRFRIANDELFGDKGNEDQAY
ncbi:DUF262 domain-containing protein [Patescibacteria group bacterium]|nr:DUF262 domain-containing protein [Patescibacteria group bacterium]